MKNNLIPIYLKEALEQYSWVSFITLNYSSKKTFNNSHKTKFFSWLKSKDLNYFYTCELTKKGIPQYNILVDNDVDFKEIYSKWLSIVSGARSNCKTIDNKKEDLESISNYVSKNSSVEANSELKAFGIQQTYGYCGKEFEEFVSKLKQKHNAYLNALENKFEQDNYHKNATEAELSFRNKSFYAYLEFFLETESVNFLDKFEDIVDSMLSSAKYSTFKNVTPEEKNLVVDNLLNTNKELLLKVLLIRLFSTYKLSKNKEMVPTMSYVKFVEAVFMESIYCNLNYFSRKAGAEVTNISLNFFPETLIYNFGLMLVSALNQTYAGLFLIQGTNGYNSQDFGTLSEAGKVDLIIKTEDALALSMIEKCTNSFFFMSLYPMVCEPKPWTAAKANEPLSLLNENYSGGYLLNAEKRINPLLETQHDYKVESLNSFGNDFYTAINFMQNNSFSIDYEYIELYKSKLAIKQADFNIAENSIKNDLAEYVQIKRVNRKNTVQFKKYVALKQKLKDAFVTYGTGKAEKEAFIYIENMQGYFDSINKFYFPYNIDPRGRYYISSDLTPISSKFVRACLSSSQMLVANIEVMKVATIAKLPGGSRLSYDQQILKFDKEYESKFLCNENVANDRLNTLLALVDQEDKAEFLRCWLEWRRYFKFIQNKNDSSVYLNNWLVGFDATSSGYQISALLLNDERYANEINLIEADKSTPSMSIYTSNLSKFLGRSRNNSLWLELGFEDRDNYASLDYLKNIPANAIVEEYQMKFFRPLFKALIMPMIYGLTKNTYKQKVQEYFLENKFMPDKIKESTNYFSELAYNFVKKSPLSEYVLIANKIANAFKEVDIPINWNNGFIKILQSYKRFKAYKIRRAFVKYKKDNKSSKQSSLAVREENNSKSIIVKLADKENPVNWSKNVTAFPANLIHSLDAAIITKLMLELNEEGFRDMSIFAIHDCVYVHSSYVHHVHGLIREVNQKLFQEKDAFDALMLHFLALIEEKNKKVATRLKKEVEEILLKISIKDPKFATSIDDAKECFNMYLIK